MKWPLAWRSTKEKLVGQLLQEQSESQKLSALLTKELRMVRVGFFPFDIMALTAELRGKVESDIIIKDSPKGFLVYAGRPLAEAEVNRVIDILGIRADRFNRT